MSQAVADAVAVRYGRILLKISGEALLGQRPYGVDRIVTAMANEVYVFKTDEPRDVQYLRERLGDGIVEKLAALEQYQYVLQKDHSSEFVIGKDQL